MKIRELLHRVINAENELDNGETLENVQASLKSFDISNVNFDGCYERACTARKKHVVGSQLVHCEHILKNLINGISVV